jgi:hypothetical protein
MKRYGLDGQSLPDVELPEETGQNRMPKDPRIIKMVDDLINGEDELAFLTGEAQDTDIC